MNKISLDTEAARQATFEEPVTAATPQGYPAIDERPCYRVFDDWLETDGRKLRPGVYYFGMRAGKGDAPPAPYDDWICSPVHILAVTRDESGGNYGRLLRFLNSDRRWRTWAMPMNLLRGDGSDLRGELLDAGVLLDARNRHGLAAYLQAKEPTRRVLAATRVGWAGGNFVLPGEVIGPNPESVIFQSPERASDAFSRAGSLKGWIENVASKAINNPVLALALSTAFAGPLLNLCHAEGGGVHLVGDSSTGKTTAAEAAASVWGGAAFKRSWRATANGVEGAAALSNDTLLVLDEISEADPREVGQIAYLLANGAGKQRAGRNGTARAVQHWRTLIVSTGERTIATAMLEGGHRAKAGQSVRLLDVPCQRTFGAWDALHGAADGRAFSDALKTAVAKHHGHAGRAFLERLTMDEQDFAALLTRLKSLPAFCPSGASEQEKRAGGRFALIAMAGELATDYGLTGWAGGEATMAAAIAFEAWRGMREGQGANAENVQIVAVLADFIAKHGDSRFSDRNADSALPVRDRAGWWEASDDGRVYLFTGAGLREALRGFDFNRALDIMELAGIIPTPGPDKKRAKSERIGGRVVKLYHVFAHRLDV
jgi:putative DNA primase/helicase